jgi:peptidyl-prolyl cis-trans isomerase A (cyclophilin A)
MIRTLLFGIALCLGMMIAAGCIERTEELADMPPHIAAALRSNDESSSADSADSDDSEPDAEDPHAELLDPMHERFQEKAPDAYRVKFHTSAGDFIVRVERAWSPRGADRFHNLVKHGFYDGVRFFRVVDGFVAQFGIHGEPRVSEAWREARIDDDPVVQSNHRGTLVYATSGADSRTAQLFINYKDNTEPLDGMGFSPFAEVVEGMDVVDSLYAGYGEGAPRGRGPNQMLIQRRGNAYLKEEFSRLDHIITARITEDAKENSDEKDR